MKHLFPAPDMKRGTYAYEENRACEALAHAAWAAQFQGNKCCHLSHLYRQEAGVLTSSACICLTSKLRAAAWSPVTQSMLRGPSEARGWGWGQGQYFELLQRRTIRCVEQVKVGYWAMECPQVPDSRKHCLTPPLSQR